MTGPRWDGRRRGEGNPRARLTAEQVAEIRAETVLTQREMAQKYGVSYQTINDVVRGVTWTLTT